MTLSTMPSALSTILRSGRSSSSGARACAALVQAAIGLPERLQDRFQQRSGLVVRRAVDRRLGLLVGQLRRRAHDDAVERVAALAPVAPKIIRTARAGRSSPSRSEHRSLEMRSGSIGTTRSGK
jgi:hypothetical protein